jgi:tRNA (mo5U34)-methyltransferase
MISAMSEPRWRTIARALVSRIRPRPSLLQPARRMSRTERQAVAAKIKALQPWFHNMNLGRGLWTHPDDSGAGPDYPAWRWHVIKTLLPDVKQKACLDIGCSSGFFSLKLKELGAGYVLGVDQGEQVLAIEQARFAAQCLGWNAEFQPMSVYDAHALNRQFDLVLFMGVFYHLRHPLLALEAIRKVCRDTLIIQTITTAHETSLDRTVIPVPMRDAGLRSSDLNRPDFPLMRFVEGGLDGDQSCWFIPSLEAVLALLRSSGFQPEQLDRSNAHEVVVRARVV